MASEDSRAGSRSACGNRCRRLSYPTVVVNGRRPPPLVVLAGLPGVGKSAVADGLSRRLRVPVLSVDPIEEGMHRAGVSPGFTRGLAAYLVAAQVADHLLGLGHRVIIDAVNAEPAGRATWRELADRHGTRPAFIEVVCADRPVHRARLEGRTTRHEGVQEPGWAAVQARRAGFDGWDDERLVLDSRVPAADLVDQAAAWLDAGSV